MLEVMVSVLIFCIGVLGFASLQSRSIQATFDNGQRDQVVWLTQSLIDRVRVNSSAEALGRYASGLTDFGDFATDCTPPTPLCDTADCNVVEMAAFDVWDLYCNNIFQGSRAIKSLSVDLTCRDGACDGAVEDLALTTQWCARGLESEVGSATGGGPATTGNTACDNNAVAQMNYEVVFRP